MKQSNPIILKKVLELSGVSFSEFAESYRELSGAAISKTTVFNLLNFGIIPKRISGFRDNVECLAASDYCSALAELDIRPSDIWGVLKTNTKNKQSEEEPMERCEILTRDAMEHFGVKIDPFMPIYTKESDILMLQSHYNALENMRITAELGLMTAITGQVGSGKSTVRIKFKSQMRSSKYVLVQPETKEIGRITTREILEAILRKLSEEKPKRNLEALSVQVNAALVNLKNQGKRCILFIEEAQDLHTHTLKRLKRLWETRDEEDEITPLISIILIAQNELAYKLYGSQNMNLREVASRMTHVELGAINHELYDYFKHKFKCAGLDIEKIVTKDAVARISEIKTEKDANNRSRPVAYPNEMNNIMKQLMNFAALSGEDIITLETVNMAGV